MRQSALSAAALLLLGAAPQGEAHPTNPWVVYPGGEGPGRGKHIVFVTGEESYRSEESMPLLARILSRYHGFKCTVLFAIDPKDGTINPNVKDNIPGLEALETADLMVAFLRWRELPDEQMKRIIDYTESGRPILGLRNATHPFRYEKLKDSPYAKYDWKSKDPEGGWGRLVLGETWVSHYAKNLVESTRCNVVEEAAAHPILRGIPRSFWIPDDVYGISTLKGDCAPILLGQPLLGWKPEDPPRTDRSPIPIVWTKSYTGASGKAARICTSTMGHGEAFKREEFRRLLVNACYWCLGLEDRIDGKRSVDLIGTYDPGPIGAKGLRTGVRPSELEMPAARDLPPTLMTSRGKLLLEENFSKALPPPTGSTARFASGYSGWRFNVESRGGHWELVDGTFRGTENAEHRHPATASYGFDFKDVIIQCDVRLEDVPPEGRRYRYFNLRTTDKKDYVCSIILTQAGMRIQKDDNDHDGPDVAVPLGELKTPVRLGEWQSVVMEILGEEMVGTLDGKSLTGQHSLIGSEKKSFMFVSGTECSIRNLRVWEALPNPEWARNREALKAGK